jgi:gluconokinase
MNPIIVMGVSGCGKSSVGERLAAHFGLTYVEGDALHPAGNVAKMAAGTPLSDEDRWPWLDRIGAEMASHRQEGRPIVVSCSALKKIYRDHLRQAVGGKLDFVFLEGSFEVLSARMAARKGHFMPVSLLESQMKTLEPPTGEPGVVTVNIGGSKEDTVIAAIKAVEDHHHMSSKTA